MDKKKEAAPKKAAKAKQPVGVKQSTNVNVSVNVVKQARRGRYEDGYAYRDPRDWRYRRRPLGGPPGSAGGGGGGAGAPPSKTVPFVPFNAPSFIIKTQPQVDFINQMANLEHTIRTQHPNLSGIFAGAIPQGPTFVAPRDEEGKLRILTERLANMNQSLQLLTVPEEAPAFVDGPEPGEYDFASGRTATVSGIETVPPSAAASAMSTPVRGQSAPKPPYQGRLEVTPNPSEPRSATAQEWNDLFKKEPEPAKPRGRGRGKSR